MYNTDLFRTCFHHENLVTRSPWETIAWLSTSFGGACGQPEMISSTDWFLLPFLIQALSMQASPGANQVPQQASRRNHFFYRLVSAPIPHSSLVYASIPWQNKCRSKPVEDIISSTDWLRQLAMGSSFWRLGRKDMETQSSLRIPAGYTPQAGLGFHYRSFSLPATAAHLSCNHNPWPKGRVTT